MLCNPHNPTGRTRKLNLRFLQRSGDQVPHVRLTLFTSLDSRETLRSYCLFAERYDLHLVVDEVYGMSVFSTDGTAHRFVIIVRTSSDRVDFDRLAKCTRVHERTQLGLCLGAGKTIRQEQGECEEGCVRV